MYLLRHAAMVADEARERSVRKMKKNLKLLGIALIVLGIGDTATLMARLCVERSGKASQG